MTQRYAAFLRGINVGRAKRVAMADLRRMVAGLGFDDVRTLLASGNVVFSHPGIEPAVAGRRIEEGLATRLGVPARVTVLTAGELATAVAENPLVDLADNPSRLLVAVLSKAADREDLEPLTRGDWSPEAFAVGRRVAYLWCPESILASPLSKAVNRALGDRLTARNWATTLKVHALAGS